MNKLVAVVAVLSAGLGMASSRVEATSAIIDLGAGAPEAVWLFDKNCEISPTTNDSSVGIARAVSSVGDFSEIAIAISEVEVPEGEVSGETIPIPVPTYADSEVAAFEDIFLMVQYRYFAIQEHWCYVKVELQEGATSLLLDYRLDPGAFISSLRITSIAIRPAAIAGVEPHHGNTPELPLQLAPNPARSEPTVNFTLENAADVSVEGTSAINYLEDGVPEAGWLFEHNCDGVTTNDNSVELARAVSSVGDFSEIAIAVSEVEVPEGEVSGETIPIPVPTYADSEVAAFEDLFFTVQYRYAAWHVPPHYSYVNVYLEDGATSLLLDARVDPGAIQSSLRITSIAIRPAAPAGVEPHHGHTPELPLRLAPNPARSEPTVNFVLKNAADVSLEVIDVHGRLVRRLAPGTLSTGPHAVTWDGTDNAGARSPDGRYFLRVLLDGRVSGRTSAVLLR